jgi:hypothetical protein
VAFAHDAFLTDTPLDQWTRVSRQRANGLHPVNLQETLRSTIRKHDPTHLVLRQTVGPAGLRGRIRSFVHLIEAVIFRFRMELVPVLWSAVETTGLKR